MGMEVLKTINPTVLTKFEETWLRANHPWLRYFPLHKLIYGPFHFDATYNGVRIIDQYTLSIDLTPKLYGRLPIVYEDARRIKLIAKILNRPLCDLHVNEDESLCLIRPDKFFERYKYGVPLPQFFDHLKSHLYWISHVERYNREPWEGEKHGWDIDEIKKWIQEQKLFSTK